MIIEKKEIFISLRNYIYTHTFTTWNTLDKRGPFVSIDHRKRKCCRMTDRHQIIIIIIIFTVIIKLLVFSFFFCSFAHLFFSVLKVGIHSEVIAVDMRKAHRSSLTMLISFLTFSFVVSLSLLFLSREASHLFPILLFAYNQPSMLAKTSEIAFVYLVNSRLPFFLSRSLRFPSTNN